MRYLFELVLVLLLLLWYSTGIGQNLSLQPALSAKEKFFFQFPLKAGIVKQNRTFVNQVNTIKQSPPLQQNILPQQNIAPTTTVYSTQCIDTSVRLTYTKDAHWLSNGYVSRTQDGGLLVPGYDSQLGEPYLTTPHLLKLSLQGDTIWSRAIQVGYGIENNVRMFNDVYHAFELRDGSILLVGDVEVPMNVDSRMDFLMVRLSSSGDLIWEKTFSNTLWNSDTTSGSLQIFDCKQDLNGDLYLCGNTNHFGAPLAALLFKMTIDGEMIWSKNYFIRDLPVFAGMDISADTLRAFGSVAENGPGGKLMGIAIKTETGDTLWSKTWIPTGNDQFRHSFVATNVTKLNNGNYALSGFSTAGFYRSDSTQLYTHNGMVEFTPNFDVIRSLAFRSNYSGADDAQITVFGNGTIAYERLQNTSPYGADMVLGTYQNGQIKKERIIPYRGTAISWTSNFLPLDDGGQMITNYINDSLLNTGSIELIRLHNSDTSGACLGNDAILTTVESYELSIAHLPFDSTNENVFYERHHPFNGVFSDTVRIGSSCRQIHRCDSLKIVPSLATLCFGTPISLSIRKNKACGAFPSFSYDTSSVQSFIRINDTTVSLSFKRPWQGYITAGIDGCNPLSDSVKLTVLQAPPQLNLGSDTVLCPGNTVLLNARSGYASYRWQDGSSDSLFTIIKPGKYYVTATNACGGSFSDTVVVASHSPIPFHVRSDTSVCEGNSMLVTAQAGFIRYRWFPNTGISSDTGQTVTLSPTVSTFYKVTAEQTQDCFASDSFTVTVKRVSTIKLGSDTSLCSGQSLDLDAGTSFSSYYWNTGDTTQTLRVTQKGSYWVKATSSNGCSSSDKLSVINVYPLPAFTLGKDTALCGNQQIIYDFSLQKASYLWNNGSPSSRQVISQPGSYWLSVTQQGCTKYDTVSVAFQPSPVVNLGNDTTLCEGTTKLLDATNSNAVYHWQDNSSSSQYLVQQAGLYSVTATMGGCSASDSVQITYTAKPHFNLGKDTFLCQGSTLLLSPFMNTPVTYLWQDGSTYSSYSVQRAGIYSLSASNDCGSLKDSVRITVEVCKLNMPSAFTPNKDGLNDIFKVKYPFLVKQFNLVIYNRWGQKMFESNDMIRGWDGTLNNIDQDPGTYVWMISLVDNDNTKQKAHGTVTLIR